MAHPALGRGVTFVSSHSRPGGSERYLAAVLGRLRETRIERVVCLEDGPFVEGLVAAGHDVRVVPISDRLIDLARGSSRVRDAIGSPAVVHANGVKAAAASVLATKGLEVPVIWLKHDFAYDGWRARAVGRRCARVVGVSRAVVETFGPDFPTPVQVVHGGIELRPPDRAAGRVAIAELTGTVQAGPTVCLVGRFHPLKGHIDALSVGDLLRRHNPRARLLFVGGRDPATPAHMDVVRGAVADRGLGDVVVFADHRDDAIDIMAASDVGLVPSVEWGRGMGREGFPIVALELMLAGTPVVGYRHGGLPEVLGECGALVAPGDRDALADAALNLVRDPERAAHQASCGAARVGKFDLAAMVERLEGIYAEIARG